MSKQQGDLDLSQFENQVAVVTGAGNNGIGWGIAGLCPGPGIAALVIEPVAAAIFVVAMLAGMAVVWLLEGASS